ncbi:MAG TPA: Vi polysaccharide biosynthesis UDP-N-acetylglucosamine C-6 dehydrogenase TviB [Spongiibacteraceae bacterium]|nr:Vi polysaccharide biosynthesis UDP-N-acetylglucosamine C-6 dehydrogenase TviB [Spongiibacteraceae bacterium]
MSNAPLPALDSLKLSIVGLGYVGLPLAVEFGKQLPTIGFDINRARINSLREGRDITRETSSAELASARLLTITDDSAALSDCNVHIVTVPTPVDGNKQPDLSPLERASETVGKTLKRGDVVIYESTVYPGATEEVCVPVLERVSGLRFNQDFYAGYSPERINPGDKQRRLTNILKITSGSTPEVAGFVDALYRRIVTAGTHRAESIRVAEAAKVIENTQRDVNIALVNELAQLFKRLGIDTEAVLKAAGTKWNFLPFRPGLVGGHCIGVDPYYLANKAQQHGYFPEIITASRRINDGMGVYVAREVMRLMTQKRIHIVDANILVMGLAFKENCPDLRNTRVTDIIEELRICNAHVDIFDPWVDPEEAQHELGVSTVAEPASGHYDAVIIAVAHDQFREMGVDAIRALARPDAVIFDIKYLLPTDAVDGRL